MKSFKFYVWTKLKFQFCRSWKCCKYFNMVAAHVNSCKKVFIESFSSTMYTFFWLLSNFCFWKQMCGCQKTDFDFFWNCCYFWICSICLTTARTFPISFTTFVQCFHSRPQVFLENIVYCSKFLYFFTS